MSSFVQIKLFDPSYTSFLTAHSYIVERGAVVLKTTVPASVPLPEVSTGILKVFASITVATKVPLIVFAPLTHPVPVAPLIVTDGREEIANPCPVEVTTPGDALLTAEIETEVVERVPVVTTDLA